MHRVTDMHDGLSRVRRCMVNAVCLALALTLFQTAAAQSGTLLHEMFQDGAVLQRDRPVNVWGRAAPNAEVTVSFAGNVTNAHADNKGHWTAVLPAMKFGGPHELKVKTGDGASQAAHDVLVGDVWLCSGQSNMVLQVHRALDSRAEIARSDNDSIRMLTVALHSSLAPLEHFSSPVRWQKAAPATVPEFSAACYYFARELQRTVQVPMGLINAAWGGSKIQTWMSKEALQATGEYDASLAILDRYATDRAAATERFGKSWQAWWRDELAMDASDEPWSATRELKGIWRTAPAELGAWEGWGIPELAEFDGMVWYRTTVQLTAAQTAQPASLALGAVDEVDVTWVNGRPVGTLSGPDVQREYTLPRKLLKAGSNVIVVNVLDSYSSGGISGPAQKRALRFADGTSIPLTGPWSYRVTQNMGRALRAPWESVSGLSTIFNGMIAPLGEYSLRGVAWYQGESNTEEASKYRSLLGGLLADWRKRYGADLPFLIVQLANFGPAPTRPGESGWAELREAQRLAVAKDAHAGLAIAVDIGDRYDIHPANKQEVGRRLARAARRVAYGESITPSGPVPLAARREGTSVVVTFGDITQRLIAYGADGPVGFELCGADPGSCRYANAALQADRVVLSAPSQAAQVRVRYCWANSPVCTLYDESRLPAGPFEIKIE